MAVVGAASVGKAFDPAGGGQGPAGGAGTWNTGDYYSGGGSGHVTAPDVVTPLDGIRRRAEAAGITVLSSPTNNATAAAALAAQADVTIVVGATSSGEALGVAESELLGAFEDLEAMVRDEVAEIDDEMGSGGESGRPPSLR